MIENKLKLLEEKNAAAEAGGGEDKVRRQHADGKMTARERIEFLLDDGSFEELDKLKTHRCLDFGMESQQYPGDGFVTGHGLIDGREVFVFAQDFTVFGGSLSETNAAKIVKVIVNGAGGKINCRDSAMKTALESASVTTDGNSNIIWSSAPGEIKMLKGQHKLIICSRSEFLAMGASIAITEDGGKPKIYLHPGNIAASGVTLSDAVLKIGEKL